VALKLMRHEDQFKREVDTRSARSLDAKHVMGIVRKHTPADSDGDLLTASLPSLGSDLSQFSYVVVLPAGDKTCLSIVDSERSRPGWRDTTRSLIECLVSSLAHMHGKGVIHGDVKPRQIVRFDGSFRLIDLDASVQVGDPLSDKTLLPPYNSTAFAPPELHRLLQAGAVPSTSSAACVGGGGSAVAPPAAPGSGGGSLNAHPSFDMWGVGATLFLMVEQGYLFPAAPSTDHLSNPQDSSSLASWSFADLQAKLAGLTDPEDRTARALLYDLLDPDPLKRISAKDVLQHPYITRHPIFVPLSGEVADYDVFISYRVATEGRKPPQATGSGLVARVVSSLRNQGLSVWVDYEQITPSSTRSPADTWREVFCRGLMKSRVFLPLISGAAFTHWKEGWWKNNHPMQGGNKATIDNVLLEHRLAFELLHRGQLLIFPILFNGCRAGGYPPDDTHTPNFTVGVLEEVVRDEFSAAQIRPPETSPTVTEIWNTIYGKQGSSGFDGKDPTKWEQQLRKVAIDVHGLRFSSPHEELQRKEFELARLTADVQRLRALQQAQHVQAWCGCTLT